MRSWLRSGAHQVPRGWPCTTFRSRCRRWPSCTSQSAPAAPSWPGSCESPRRASRPYSGSLDRKRFVEGRTVTSTRRGTSRRGRSRRRRWCRGRRSGPCRGRNRRPACAARSVSFGSTQRRKHMPKSKPQPKKRPHTCVPKHWPQGLTPDLQQAFERVAC